MHVSILYYTHVAVNFEKSEPQIAMLTPFLKKNTVGGILEGFCHSFIISRRMAMRLTLQIANFFPGPISIPKVSGFVGIFTPFFWLLGAWLISRKIACFFLVLFWQLSKYINIFEDQNITKWISSRYKNDSLQCSTLTLLKASLQVTPFPPYRATTPSQATCPWCGCC